MFVNLSSKSPIKLMHKIILDNVLHKMWAHAKIIGASFRLCLR